MEFDRFHHFASLLIEDDFVLTYRGYVTEDILQAIGDTLRQQLLVKSHNRNQVRNLFSVFVELMQNVIRYGHEGPQPSLSTPAQKPVGLVLVAQNGQQINLLTGNYVTNDEANALQEKVNFLNTKSAEELRQIYYERLRQPPDNASKGASIGLIEIARRSMMTSTTSQPAAVCRNKKSTSFTAPVASSISIHKK
jgi:hypothetical protein